MKKRKHQISVSIDEELYDEMMAESKASSVSLSTIVNMRLRGYELRKRGD